MKSLIYLALTFLLVFSSCRKTEDCNTDGPDLINLFGDFSILTDVVPSQTVINFEQGESMYFTGSLSKSTDWVITFVGQESGAVRTISGNSNVFNEGNSEWDGGANDFPAFNLEDVDVTITFPLEDDSPSLTFVLTITGLRQDVGYLITSFEEGFGDTWERFNQTTVSGDIECGDGQAAVGDCYYGISGVVGWDWAKGSVMVRPEAGQTNFGLPASASNLYFNMAFKAVDNVGPTSSFMLFWFDEDDNGDGVFDENTEDRIVYEYWSQDSDWDLISLNYADLQFDIEGNQIETNGNGLMEPSKLIGINVFFLADPEGGLSTGYADHLIFTVDQPYTP